MKADVAAYRRRHVIAPRMRFGDRENVFCEHDGIRVVRRKRGWRHDPDEVKRLARAAVLVGA